MRVVGLIFLASFGAVSWASGCIVDGVVATSEPVESEAPPLSCNECVEQECPEALQGCEGDAACPQVMACVTDCNVDEHGSPSCIYDCLEKNGLEDDDHARDVYRGVLSSCTVSRCQASCVSVRGYCGIASYVAALSQKDKAACRGCLSKSCCDIGRRCGLEAACFSGYLCELSCYPQTEEPKTQCTKCKMAPGGDRTELFNEFWACMSDFCPDKC